MPSRWVICPVITVGNARKPKVSIIADPGIPPYQVVDVDEDTGVTLPPVTVRKTYNHSSCIDKKNWALCFVRGVDLSALDSDPDIITLFDFNDQGLNATVNDLRWSNNRLKRLKNLAESKGANFNGLTKSDPLWKYVKRIGEAILPNFTPKGTWVK